MAGDYRSRTDTLLLAAPNLSGPLTATARIE
jgi:hypothetical protein